MSILGGPPEPPSPPPGARMVHCVKFGRELPGLDEKPWPGELGQRIYDNVSAEAWKLWEERMKMILNEYRLLPFQKEAQELDPAAHGGVLLRRGRLAAARLRAAAGEVAASTGVLLPDERGPGRVDGSARRQRHRRVEHDAQAGVGVADGAHGLLGQRAVREDEPRIAVALGQRHEHLPVVRRDHDVVDRPAPPAPRRRPRCAGNGRAPAPGSSSRPTPRPRGRSRRATRPARGAAAAPRGSVTRSWRGGSAPDDASRTNRSARAHKPADGPRRNLQHEHPELVDAALRVDGTVVQAHRERRRARWSDAMARSVAVGRPGGVT